MRVLILLYILVNSIGAISQFNPIPTGTNATIGELGLNGDTLLISAHPDYFAKYIVSEGTLIQMDAPGPTIYRNTNLQVVDNNYYILSSQGLPYDHNLILKSSNGGLLWDTLVDLPGLFYTMTIIDSTFGIIAGGFGSYATTNGSDDDWIMQDSLTGTITASVAYGDSTIFMTSLLNMCYLTNDRGQNWIENSGAPSTLVNEMQFFNHDTIYLISNQGTSSHTSYLKSTFNQGGSWLLYDFSYEYNFLSNYEFYSEAKDMIINQDGSGYVLAYLEKTVYNWSSSNINRMALFSTNDYGHTWTPFITEYTEVMFDLIFLNDSTAFIGGQNGLLLLWDLTIPLSNVLEINESDHESQAINFFPNPVSVDATLVVDHSHLPVTLVVTDQLGRIVQTEFIFSESTTISFESLPDGIYYYFMGEIRGQFVVSK